MISLKLYRCCCFHRWAIASRQSLSEHRQSPNAYLQIPAFILPHPLHAAQTEWMLLSIDFKNTALILFSKTFKFENVSVCHIWKQHAELMLGSSEYCVVKLDLGHFTLPWRRMGYEIDTVKTAETKSLQEGFWKCIFYIFLSVTASLPFSIIQQNYC